MATGTLIAVVTMGYLLKQSTIFRSPEDIFSNVSARFAQGDLNPADMTMLVADIVHTTIEEVADRGLVNTGYTVTTTVLNFLNNSRHATLAVTLRFLDEVTAPIRWMEIGLQLFLSKGHAELVCLVMYLLIAAGVQWVSQVCVRSAVAFVQPKPETNLAAATGINNTPNAQTTTPKNDLPSTPPLCCGRRTQSCPVANHTSTNA